MHLKSVADTVVTVGRTPTGETRQVYNFYGLASEGKGGPQGFIVQMPGGNTGRPHFHTVDQFQVFFGGPGGVYQKQPIGPVMIHYSDGYTPYGPFSSGERLMEFFTLRAQPSTLTAYMPESREKLIRKARRSITVPAPNVGAPLARSATVVETLIEPQADGVAAWVLRGGPGARMQAPSPRGSSGQYHLVAGGAVIQDGRFFGKKSLAWLGPDESPPEVVAGDDIGFDVLVMQFPNPPSAAGLPT